MDFDFDTALPATTAGVAGTVVDLCPDAAYATGRDSMVDGGYAAR